MSTTTDANPDCAFVENALVFVAPKVGRDLAPLEPTNVLDIFWCSHLGIIVVVFCIIHHANRLLKRTGVVTITILLCNFSKLTGFIKTQTKQHPSDPKMFL